MGLNPWLGMVFLAFSPFRCDTHCPFTLPAYIFNTISFKIYVLTWSQECHIFAGEGGITSTFVTPDQFSKLKGKQEAGEGVTLP